MTVEISPCVVGDVEEMAEVASDAFGVSPITIARWRGFSRSFKLERGKKRFGDMFRREPNPSKLEFQVVKATDSTTGEMMGLASWIHFRHGYDKENDPMAELPDESTPGDKKLLTDFALLTEEIRSEHPLRKEPHWLLDILCTSPKHERKGVASKLVKSIYPRLDADGEPCFLEATSMGHGMYERCGFRDIGKTTIDLEGYECGQGLGKQTFTAMIREPERKS